MKPPSSIPTLGKKQSSLTQMQWTGTPRQTIAISSDEDNDEYKEPPAKKQKISAKKGKKLKLEDREAGQSSFTQVDYLGRMRLPRRSDMDAEGFQIWHDSDTEEDFEDSSPVPAGPSALSPTTKNELSEREIPEIAESSQSISNEGQQDDVHSSEPECKPPKLRTPQKVRFVEVTSSQTPPSTRLSTQRPSLRERSVSCSPLKERSGNAQSPLKKLQSPESQNMSMKMLERVRFANQQRARKGQPQSENRFDEDLVQCAAEATDEFSLRTYPMPPPPPRALERRTTVQDSQADDLDTTMAFTQNDARPKLVRTGTIADSQRDSSNETIAEDSQAQRPVRRLRRVATVQDSQADDSDFDFDDDAALAKSPGNRDTIYNDVIDDEVRSDHFGEGTYDPAFSALDRDASRFQWTQTQGRLPVGGEDSETENEDLDRGCTTNLPVKDGKSCDDETAKIIEHPAPLSSPEATTESNLGTEVPVEGAVDPSFSEAALRDDSACESGDQISALRGNQVPSSPPPPEPLHTADGKTASTEESHVPSSPPPLRPSQVSTVVPTQASTEWRAQSPQKKIKAEPFSQPPTPRHQQKSQTFNFLSSPQKPSSLWQPESLSSSPLPPPPWNSPGKHRFVHPSRETEGSLDFGTFMQMDSLADFSLPPPPPLSSSRRQTPASSSL